MQLSSDNGGHTPGVLEESTQVEAERAERRGEKPERER